MDIIQHRKGLDIIIIFSPGMEAIQLDGDILFGLLKKTSPAIHKHLKDQDIVPILYMQVCLI